MDGSGGSRDGGRDVARWTVEEAGQAVLAVGELTGEEEKGIGISDGRGGGGGA